MKLSGRRLRPSAWRATVLLRAKALESELAEIRYRREVRRRHLGPSDDDEEATHQLELIQREIGSAMEAALDRGGPLYVFADWVSGWSAARAWSSLDAAAEQLVFVQPSARLTAQLPDLRAALKSYLSADDPRRVPALSRVDELIANPDPNKVDAAREGIRAYLAIANAANAAAQSNVRGFRNQLLAQGTLLGVLLVALAFVQGFDSSFVKLTEPRFPRSIDFWELEILGALGATLAAIFSLVRVANYSGPFRLDVALLVSRVTTGAAAAVIGTIVVQQTALVSDVSLSLIVWAVLFGMAVDPLFRILDRRAMASLGDARDKNDPRRYEHALPAPIQDIAASVDASVQRALVGPVLRNWRGFVTASMINSSGLPIPMDGEGRIMLVPASQARLRVSLSRKAAQGDLSAPVDVLDGQPADDVPFEIEVESETIVVPRRTFALTASSSGQPVTVTLDIRLPSAEGIHSLWIQVRQEQQGLQVLPVPCVVGSPGV